MKEMRRSDLTQIMGRPDGPMRFIPNFGFEVPTFEDPRYDLQTPEEVGEETLDYHVPFQLRGVYVPAQLPESGTFYGTVDQFGYALCMGTRKDGLPCKKRAEHRTSFCALHGARLHRADMKITRAKIGKGIVPDSSQMDFMTRAQKVSNGLIKVSELSDEEIMGSYVINDDGRRVSMRKAMASHVFEEAARELHLRMNDFMQMKSPKMLQVITDIAEDPINEPDTRLKAAIWAAERVIGKTPNVIVAATSDKPIDQIFTALETTSRDAYRKQIESSRPDQETDQDALDVEVVEDGGHGSAPNLLDAENGRDGSDVRRMGTADTKPENHIRNSVPARDNDSPTGIVDNPAGLDSSESNVFEEATESDFARDDDSRISLQKRLKARKAEMDAAKARRYAARASGATTLKDIPWLIEIVPRKDGCFNMRIFTASDQTPAVVDRLRARAALEAADEIVA